MRVLVFGYHDIGYEGISELLAQGHEIVALVTHEDNPDENVWFRSVAELAAKHNLPTYKPENPNEPEFVEFLRSLAPDIVFSFYYRHLLKKPLLELAPKGALNLHGSYLPKYRGRAPVNWVLLRGETETGVTLHYMIEKPDAGDIVAQKKVPIAFEDTALSLYSKLTKAARELMHEVLPLLEAGTAPRIPQDESQATYFGGRKPADGRFEWSQPAVEIYNLVRAVTHPYPGAFVTFGEGDNLFVWWAKPVRLEHQAEPGTVMELRPEGPLVACGKDALLLLQVQVGEAPELEGAAFARKYGLEPGKRL